MVKVDVHLDEGNLQTLLSYLDSLAGLSARRIMPGAKTAFDMAVVSIQRSWQDWAMGGELEGARPIKNPSPNLARSIKVERQSDFSAKVYTESPYMARIQEGSPEYDMKNPSYYAGRKSRVGKGGVPYVIIPFRWGTPNGRGGARAHFSNMAEISVVELLRRRKAYTAVGVRKEANARGEMIDRNVYNKGGGAIGEDESMHPRGYDVGMRRIGGGGARGSQYFTFRVISARSASGWVRKAVAANDVLGALKRNLEPRISGLINEGLKADLDLQ